MTVAVLIVAAGRGARAGGGIPKQWRDLGGASVAERAMRVFAEHPRVDSLALVLHPEDIPTDLWPRQPAARIVPGGASRTASVRAGLEALAARCDRPERVLIHDAARPLVSPALIDRVLDALDDCPGAAPALAVSDALWRGTGGRVAGTADRDGLFAAQTPQGFDFATILAAHRAYQGDAADDVEVARAAGHAVAIVQGDADNIKITTPGDFARAERLMGGGMEFRTGSGYDVHAFGPGDHVVLCGVAVPHDKGLKGHSDADVGIHALCDAIYGALAEGDIGRHFPPSDPQWRGAASATFLAHAAGRARERGFRLGNCDVTLICERPKIAPHAAEMEAKLAAILGVGPGRVGVKATTSEGLGFTGRAEGIAAFASVMLVAP